MRTLTQALTLTSIATAVRGAFKIAAVNPVLWWDAESHRSALTSGGAATLFQDAAGIAAGGVEQPVGLVRDISKSTLGSERNPGLGFGAWSVLGGAWTLSSTSAVGVNATGFILNGTAASPAFGGYWEVSGTISGYSAGHIFVSVTSGVNDSGTISGNGTFKVRCYDYGADNAGIYIRGNGFTGTLTSLSIKQVLGLHAAQATSTARPLLTARKNLGIRTNTFFNTSNTYTPGAYGTLARITKISSGVSYAQSETQSTFVAGTTITVSVRVKWDGHDIPDFSLEYNNLNNFGTAFIARWNVTSAGVSLALQSACTASAVAESNGVYRLSATFVTGAAAAITAGTNPTVLHKMQGVSGATILAGDFQIEYGASATGYQQVISSADYDITAAPLMLRHDAIDDTIAAAFAPSTLPASADVYIVLNRDVDDGNSAIGIDLTAGGRVFGMMAAGDATGAFSGCGSPSASVNGVGVPGSTAITRAQLHTAVGVSETRLIEVKGANLSAWAQFSTISSIQWGAMAFKGRIGAILIAPAQPDSTRAKIRKALAKAYQIQGVV